MATTSTSKRCYFCGMFTRFSPDMRRVEVVKTTYVPGYDRDGYDRESLVRAHPSCIDAHA